MTIAPRPKRRSRPSLFARVRRFWIPAIVVCALVAWGGFTLASAPVFRLHELSVTGLAHVARSDVVAHAAIDPHANVWLLDRSAIARRVEALPYVATARIHRRPVGNLWIEIVERTADGCVRTHTAEPLTVDRADRVLEHGCPRTVSRSYELRKASDVPAGGYVRESELAVLQSDAARLTVTGDRFRALRHDAFGGLEADRHDGVRIRFGDERDLERKCTLIGPIFAQLGTRGERVRALDLRAPATPVVEFRAEPPTAKNAIHTQYTQGTHRPHHNM